MKRPRLHRLAIRCAALSIAILALFVAWRRYRSVAGDPSFRLDDRWHEGHLVVDRRGAVLRELPSETGHRGRSLPLEEIGDRLVASTLVAEDRGYFEHDGIAIGAVIRAVGQNLRHRRLVSGASTITQQLVKMLDNEGRPRPRSIGEKLREAARAENLEKSVGKRAVLEAYLNRLSYGHGCTGPEAAAQGYFGKRAVDLSWAEAAWLAVLPRAPSYLDPYAHPERVILRQKKLLEQLHDEGLISDHDLSRALSEAVTPRKIERPFLAPHLTGALVEREELSPGPVTHTTIDLDLQRDVEGLVRTHLASIAAFGAANAAVLVIDNATGEVLAYVGSAEFDDPTISGQVDMVRAPRQPGSTLKPFVYALAFTRGHTAAEMLADVPTSFGEEGGEYAPANFDGTYEGPISAREALAGSLNVPAIRLAAELPRGELLSTLRDLGLVSLDRDAQHYGLSLALGSGEVPLAELASAYVALARGGERIPIRFTAPSEADLGRAPAESDRVRVLDAGAAAQIAEVLSDPLARVRGLHGRGPFDVGFPVAIKTGTSSGFRDTWTAGFTHERTVVVWVGNADGSATMGLTGATGAGPLFADVIRRAMRDAKERAPLWDASLLEIAEVCPLSGKLAGPACSEHASRHFIRGHLPTESCDLHVHAAPRAAPAGEVPWRCDGLSSNKIVILPEAFDAWLAKRPLGAPGQDPFGVPWYPRSRVAGCAPGGVLPTLRLDAPAPGTVFALSRELGGAPQRIELRASAIGGEGPSRLAAVEFVVDGVLVARSAAPFRASVEATPGDHEVLVRPIDPRAAVRLGIGRYTVR
jgi:penicillin-binding protein 1C